MIERNVEVKCELWMKLKKGSSHFSGAHMRVNCKLSIRKWPRFVLIESNRHGTRLRCQSTKTIVKCLNASLSNFTSS